jgi:hypothetical protein
MLQVEALLHAAQHGMTALKELARCSCSIAVSANVAWGRVERSCFD